MGLRLWIKTKEEPTFSLRVEWFFMNQSYEFKDGVYWFFQDEWDEDFSLYSIAGYNKNDPDAKLQKDYYKHPDRIVSRLMTITSDQIDQFFLHAWERPTVYWDLHRIIAISYLEAKVSYLKSLYDAQIIDIKNTFDIEDESIDKSLPAWYHYRYAGPDKKDISRIPGKVSRYLNV